jgi:hypothetical protein
MTVNKKVMWLDSHGEIQIDEDLMTQWFNVAILNLKEIDASKADAAWLLFLMGAETVFRANNDDVQGES